MPENGPNVRTSTGLANREEVHDGQVRAALAIRDIVIGLGLVFGTWFLAKARGGLGVL